MFGPFLMCALAAWTVLGFPPEAAASSQLAQVPLTKVRVAGWGPATGETSFFWTTVHKGYFKDEGIELEWVPGQGAGDSLRRVVTGDVTFAWSTTDALIFGAAQNAKAKGIFNLHNNFYHVVFLPERGRISKVEDLKGKKIGVTSQASLTRYTMMLAGAKAGLPQDYLTYIAVGFAPGPPLQSGQIDAAVSWPNLTNAMRAAGMKDLQEWWTGLDYPTDQIVISNETYTRNRDLADRFIRALVKGIRYENANQEEAAHFVPQYLKVPISPEVLRQYIKVTQEWMHFPETKTKGLGYTDIRALVPVVEELQKANLIKGSIDLAEYFTNEFQEKYGK
jgi:NitT/TauT family transport system substrate-binding protein